MAKRGRKPTKTEENGNDESVESTELSVEITEDDEPEPIKPEEPIEITGLPPRDLYRISEVADYLSVSERTVRMWVDHGHFTIEKFRGTIWIPKTSLLQFRLRSRIVSM